MDLDRCMYYRFLSEFWNVLRFLILVQYSNRFCFLFWRGRWRFLFILVLVLDLPFFLMVIMTIFSCSNKTLAEADPD